MRVEEHGLGEFADALRAASRGIVDDAEKITAKTCLEIKKQAADIVRGISHAPNLGRTFNYDVEVSGDTVIGEVGADITKQVGGGPHRTPGSLDHFIEDGSVRNAPVPHWRPAADKQVPLWVDYLEKAVAEAIDDR